MGSSNNKKFNKNRYMDSSKFNKYVSKYIHGNNVSSIAHDSINSNSIKSESKLKTIQKNELINSTKSIVEKTNSVSKLNQSQIERKHYVGIVVFDGERFLLLHRVLNWSGFEFPKGGIEQGETQEEAVKRELYEETSIKNFEIITKLDEFNFYDGAKKKNSLISNYLVRVSSNSKVNLNNAHVLDDKVVFEHDDFKWFFPEEVVAKLRHKNAKETMKKAIDYLGLCVKIGGKNGA
ncbi:MAG: NUDIX domain-containing protein [Candidatus ainarchaeum sp.]|nr:NUDIX domain-containing protein [Candidatus ainarchaeum sp.]